MTVKDLGVRAKTSTSEYVVNALILVGMGVILWIIEHHVTKTSWRMALVPLALLVTLPVTIMLLSPSAQNVLGKVEKRIAAVVWAVLLVCGVFFCWFIFHYGNDQFGAWDYSICIDTGWREIQGQRAFVDFITPNPPLFNLGVWGAFRVFGVHWNSQLYAIAIACVASFLWIYWLLRRLSVSPLVSLFLGFAVEAVSVLAVCFWWYNDTTELAATVFLLSSLVCIRALRVGWREWTSYVISLGLVLLSKPNVAGLMAVCYVSLLLVATKQRTKAVAMTVAGCALALGVLFATHVSLPAMLASYHGAAIERAGLHFFGVAGWSRARWAILLTWFVLLILPVYWLAERATEAIQNKDWRDAAYVLGLILPVPLAFYFISTNAEAKESETAIILVTLGVGCLASQMVPQNVRRFFVAMTIWITVVCLFYGIARARVFGIGEGSFYEQTHSLHTMHDGFFANMETTDHMFEVEEEVRRAKASFPGTIFLGPRLEFDYADLRIPSPRGWPIYYQPGTSFARRDIPDLTAFWKQQHFQTLIFLHDDRTFYPKSLLDEINDEYTEQPGFSEVDVYRRK